MTYGLIVVCLFVCVLIRCMVLVTMSDCLSMLFLVVTNFGHISISVLSTLSIKGRVILFDREIIPIKLILTEAATATGVGVCPTFYFLLTHLPYLIFRYYPWL